MTSPHSKLPRPGWRWLLLVLIVVFAIHAPSIDNDYVFDDRFSAMPEVNRGPHPMIAELQPLSEYFT
ncbi:MAG: hypothetical protein ACYTKC_16075 [Planctomycetota bacterium]|jgi:hypothetical protein